MPPSDLDMAERIVRLETKLDFLIAQFDRLPPSPVCVAKHIEYDARFLAVEAWRNRLIGIVMILNIALVIFLDKIKTFFAT
jgi:hypothetical protein